MMNRIESKHLQFYDEEHNESAFNYIILLQKLLQENINYKRENDLNKLRYPESDTIVKCNYDWQMMKLHEVYVKSPRILHPTPYNRTTTVQQNAIGLQKFKSKLPQRITMSKSLNTTTETENHLSKLELEATGQTAPKFVMKVHPRAWERQMRQEAAQRRREAYEREQKASFVDEQKIRLLEEKEKRQRIKDYVLKRYAEKELKIIKAQQRIKSLIDLEKAIEFDRKRLLTHVIRKFQNIIRWKIRNENVSDEFRHRFLIRNTFEKWKQHVMYVWGDRKERAIAYHNRHCLKTAWIRWQQYYAIARSHKWTAQDWFDLRLSFRVFRAWNRRMAKTKQLFEFKKMQADAYFNWFSKWRVLERWQRLHAILQIEKEAAARRERWRVRAIELIFKCGI